jgi:hypothetical protein
MKLRKLLTPFFALAILFSITVVNGKSQDHIDKGKVEFVAEPAHETKFVQVEGYKLDDAEYKTAVATKSSLNGISGYWFVGASLIGIFALFSRWLSNFNFGNLITYFKDQLGAMALWLQLRFSLGIVEKEELETILKAAAKENGAAISEAVKKELTEATKGLITSEQLTKKLEEIGLKDNVIKTLTDAAEKQGLELQKVIADKGKNQVKDIGQIVQENGEAIKKMADAQKGDTFKMRINTNVNKTIVERASLSDSTMGIRLPGIGELSTRGTVIESMFSRVNLSEQELKESNGVIRYMDQAAVTRNAAPVAEKGTKPESAITWIEKQDALQVIADTIPVTKQAYRHLGFVAGEIDKLLRKNHVLAKEDQLWSGTGVAPQINGIYTRTTDVVLDATLPMYQSIEGANLYDLIACLRVKITNGKQSKYMPNLVAMNPIDILRYKLAKAADGHYILPPFISADGTRIDNVIVVESSKVTANTLLIGDFSYGTIYQGEDVIIEMGLVNDQFLKNQWTIRAEQECMLLVRDVDADAFAKVTNITNAIAALETP